MFGSTCMPQTTVATGSTVVVVLVKTLIVWVPTMVVGTNVVKDVVAVLTCVVEAEVKVLPTSLRRQPHLLTILGLLAVKKTGVSTFVCYRHLRSQVYQVHHASRLYLAVEAF
jgi:hypothetical protein